MRKLAPIVLIGCLSMFFAEVFSGASQIWYVDLWAILITFPLYLGHVLFFLSIALKLKKISLSHLYLLGVIFGLYESWITKVLWTGYMDSAGPGMGTIFGVGMAEFPVLVFFWHPIMSFTLPVLVFQILTKKNLEEHEWILKRTTKKTIFIILFLISTSTFIVNGNNYNLVSSNFSLIGTLIMIFIFYRSAKNMDLNSLKMGKLSFTLLTVYLFFLYFISFLYLLPERRPQTLLPYISIIIFYIIPIILISKSHETSVKMKVLSEDSYSSRDFLKFMIILVLAVNIACINSSLSSLILVVFYFLFIFMGIAIFTIVIYRFLKQIILA